MKLINSRLKNLFFAVVATVAAGAVTWGLGDSLHSWVEVPAVGAQTPYPWTAVGSSGSVDEMSLGAFGFTNASAGYRAVAAVTPLEFRYNIVNVPHAVSATGGVPTITMPGWTTFEFGAQAPATSLAEAYLYRVNRCTGQQTLICQIRHNDQPAPGICKTCQFPANTFNFNSYLYYARVVLQRNTPNEQPMAHTLRVY